jgi:thymidylate kinase
MTNGPLPRLISIVGVDGSGKTTLAQWLNEQLVERGVNSRIVWSRFNNYLSKPLLALTRLTGHNHRHIVDGASFGFHDFENLHGYKQLFVLLQAIDVNIAAWLKIIRVLRTADVLVCERGPWDTLVDVMADTRMEQLHTSAIGRMYTMLVRDRSIVLHISRSCKNIIETRHELVHDYKMKRKIDLYEKLAEQENWYTIENNKSLEYAKDAILDVLGRAT